MTRQDIQDYIHYGIVAGIAVTFPFAIKLNSFLILLLAVNWFLEPHIFPRIRRTFSNPVNICFILLFLMHVLSALMSTNHHEGWAIVERRLSLLAFPLILFRPISVKELRIVSLAFVSGVITALIVCYCKAFPFFFHSGDVGVFFYHRLSEAIHMNAVYLSAYVILCLHVLLYLMDWKNRNLKLLFLTGFAFLVISIIMLESKMMLFILVMGFTFWFFRFSPFKSKQNRVSYITGTLFFLTILFIIPQTKSRFRTEFHTDLTVLKKDSFNDDTRFTGTSLRLQIWKQCFGIQSEKKAWFTGVGTGDFQDLLNNKYRQLKIYTGNPSLHDTGYIGYGPHNEYIELLFSLGPLAFILFLYLIFFQFRIAWKSNNYLYLQVLFLFCLFCVTESVLSTNKGIVFFTFFLVLLNSRSQTEKGWVVEKNKV